MVTNHSAITGANAEATRAVPAALHREQHDQNSTVSGTT